MKKQMWISLVAGLAVAGSLSACGPDSVKEQVSADGDAYPVDCSKIDLTKPPAEPQRLRFAHGTAAEEQVYLMEAGTETTPNAGVWYEPEYQAITNSSDRLTAIQAGQVDAASMSVPPLIVGKAKNLDFSLVASISLEAEGHFLSKFVSLKDSTVDGPEDLKGKTIGIPDYGTSSDYWAKKAVASAGLDPEKDVKYALIPLSTMEEALRQGTIDVANLVQPFYEMAKGDGGIQVVFDSLTGSDFDQELQDAIFSNEYIEKAPGAVCAWIADFKQTADAYNKDIKGSKQKIVDAKVIQASGDAYLNGQDWARPADGSIDVENLDKLIGSMKDLGILDDDVDVAGADMVFPKISATK